MERSELLSLLVRSRDAIFWGIADEALKKSLAPLLLELETRIAELEKAEL